MEAATDVMLTTAPDPRSSIPGSAVVVSQTGPKKLTRIIRSISSAGMRAAFRWLEMPALLTRMSTRPKRSSVVNTSRIALTSAGWATASRHAATTSSRRSLRRATATTVAPRLASSEQVGADSGRGTGDDGGAPVDAHAWTVLSRPDDEPPAWVPCSWPGCWSSAARAAGTATMGAMRRRERRPPQLGRPSRRQGARRGRPRRGPDGRDHRVTGDRADLPPVPPSGYDGETPTALVLNIHGLGSNGDQQASFTGMEDLAEDEGFIAIHPNGEGELPLWNYVSDNRASNDIGFMRLVAARSSGSASTPHVYATGMSNGGLIVDAVASSPTRSRRRRRWRGWPSWTGARTARRCRSK